MVAQIIMPPPQKVQPTFLKGETHKEDIMHTCAWALHMRCMLVIYLFPSGVVCAPIDSGVEVSPQYLYETDCLPPPQGKRKSNPWSISNPMFSPKYFIHYTICIRFKCQFGIWLEYPIVALFILIALSISIRSIPRLDVLLELYLL